MSSDKPQFDPYLHVLPNSNRNPQEQENLTSRPGRIQENIQLHRDKSHNGGNKADGDSSDGVHHYPLLHHDTPYQIIPKKEQVCQDIAGNINDEFLAQKLQTQYLEAEFAEVCRTEKDKELARMIQNQEFKSEVQEHQKKTSQVKILQEDDDAAIARAIQAGIDEDEISQKKKKIPLFLNTPAKDDAEEGDDAAIARAMQAEEDSLRCKTDLESGQDLDLARQLQTGENQSNPTAKLSYNNLSVCLVCKNEALSYIQTLGNKYHQECFRCMGCNVVIDASKPFAFTRAENGEKSPMHKTCYTEIFGMKCVVCKTTMPSNERGNISFARHPFFTSEQMCPKHANESNRRCCGCHRFEPEDSGFVELLDANRCACSSCCRTIVVDSKEAESLWKNVIKFFEDLGLPIWPEMCEIPVLVVGFSALNSQMGNNKAHSGSSQIMSRGLCLTEHQVGSLFELPRKKFDSTTGSFRSSDIEGKGFTKFEIPEIPRNIQASSVTAILCLSGLPSDLTSSILAHEATHAWFKLHPSFDVTRPLSMQVEEGCCQLMSMLFLNNGLPPVPKYTSSVENPSDKKLRQYFKFCIETEENEIYGDGYRLAAKAYAAIGLEALLNHVIRYHDFPLI